MPVGYLQTWQRSELGTTKKQIQQVVRAGLNPGQLVCDSDMLSTWPPGHPAPSILE